MRATDRLVQLARTVLVAAIASAAPAGAQPSAPASPPAAPAPDTSTGPTVETIIVTAQKRAESIQDVPIAMTAFSEELELPTVRDLRDLNGLSANVRVDADPSRAAASSITIRGISPTRTDDNSLDSPIAVMIDGIYLGSLTGQVLENFDLERVEILRGPQGTLYGRNTVGGVLHVIRSEPTGEWGARAQYTRGQYDQQEFRVVVNAPLIEEKLAAKVFFTDIQRDGYFVNEFTRNNQPQRDYQNFGVTLKANPTEWFQALLTIEKFDDDSQGGANLFNWNLAPGVEPAPSDPREPDYSGGLLACVLPFPQQVPCRGTPGQKLKIPNRISTDLANPGSAETAAYTLNMTADINDTMKLVSVSGYRDLVEDRILDFDGTSDNFITIERDNDFKQFSQELRLEGNWDGGFGNINYVVGGYYWWSKFQQDWITGGNFWSFVGLLSGYSLETNTWLSPALAAANAPFLPVEACITRNAAGIATFGAVRCDDGADPLAGFGANFVQRLYEKQTTESGAFFSHVDWEFIENWTLTAGIRYTTESKDFTGGQAYLAPQARQRIRNFPEYARPSNKWNDVSPKAGLSWKATEDILVYATYSEGWHSGGFFGVNQNVADFNRDQYDPEYAQSVEGGLKTQLFDNRVQANFAYFWNKFRNKQEQAVQFDGTTNTVATVFSNVASAIYQGFEAEVQVAVTEEVNVFGTFGWLDAQYVNFETDINPNDTAATTAVTCGGNFIPNTPGVPAPGAEVGGQCIEDATFLSPRNAPKYSAGVGGTVTVPYGPGTFQLFTKYSYSSPIETSLLNLTANRVSSRGDVQASLGYEVEFDSYTVGITAFGRNLTDEKFEVPTVIAPLFASSTVGLGRTWGIQLEAAF